MNTISALANASLNGTIPSQPTMDQALQVTNSIPFVIAIVVVWFLPIFLWFVTGSIARARTPDGRVTSKPMIATYNFWYAIIIWGLLQGGLMLLILFPIWLGLFG